MDRPRATPSDVRRTRESRTGAYAGLGAWAVHLTDTSNSDAAFVLVIVGLVAVVSVSFLLLRRRGGSSGSDGGPVVEDRSASGVPAHDDPDVVDDHELVKHAIRARGGRTRQSVIVEETGWSKAKVSSVLATMEEEGAISKLRVGRENLVSLPGHEPDAVESSLEE